MGCNAKEKRTPNSRKALSGKATSKFDVDRHHGPVISVKASSLAKSMLESGLKPWTYNMGLTDSVQNRASPNCPDHKTSHNPDNPDRNIVQNPGFGGFGVGSFTEDQVEGFLLKNLEFLYNEAVSELVELGYDEQVALKAVLKEGYWYGEGGMDVLTNILHNSLNYLNSKSSENDGSSEESESDFADLRQMGEDSLADMVRLVQQARPNLSRGDALRCLLIGDLNVSRASTIDLSRFACRGKLCSSTKSGSETGDTDGKSSMVSAPPGLGKFHGGMGFGNGSNSELSANGFSEFLSFAESKIQRDIGCSKKLNISPSMKSLLKRNLAAFAAALRSKEQQDMQSHSPASCAAATDSSEGNVSATDAPADSGEESSENNPDVVNSILNKFQDLNLEESLDCVAEDQKNELILTLLHQVKDLEKQVKERKEWAHQKALQAAKKLSSDLTELKMLRMEREETQRLKKGKQTLEDSTMKRLSEMETALRKASSQVDRANAAVRNLEIENAEIRAEMEASKLSASESMKTCLEVARREKKCLKRLVTWETQKAKLQEEIAAEKLKISNLKQQLVQINAAQKEAEAKWRQEVKEKELAMAQVEEERRSKEATEGNNKRKLEALRLRIEIDFQKQKDDLQRLEQELSHLKSTAQSTHPHTPKDAFITGSAEFDKHQDEAIARLLQELDEPDSESGLDRECVICKKEEVSVVFLPCAHQVMCGNCGENYAKKGRKATCPCCRAPIEKRIRVFGASS